MVSLSRSLFFLSVGFLSHAGPAALRLCLVFAVSRPPVPALVAAFRLVLQPLADRHRRLLKRPEAIVKSVQEPKRYHDRESHLGDELRPVHG